MVVLAAHLQAAAVVLRQQGEGAPVGVDAGADLPVGAAGALWWVVQQAQHRHRVALEGVDVGAR